ncbi:MAG: Txe/YoeB family addiction module toxin [Bacteroidales bacterium]|nr:Txe/YoeB family addiction module toxin [Bacteroidales bacterium]
MTRRRIRVIFSSEAWDTYIYWQKRDRKMVAKINKLIKEITRNPYSGKEKPELLKYDLSGWWSKRIEPVGQLYV